MTYSWKIAGEAGFGITTIGATFAKLCARHGLQVFGYAEYPSLIRGGFTTYEAAISTDPVAALKEKLDMLICLRQDGFDRDAHRLTAESIIIFDQASVTVQGDCIQIPIPFKDIRSKHKAYQVMVNTISMGATLAILGWDSETLNTILEEEFGKKGADVVEHNKILAKEGWDAARAVIDADKTLLNRIKQILVPHSQILEQRTSLKEKLSMVITGNDAFSFGSVIADCRGYFAYPMSPASTTLSTLAAWAKSTGMIVRHVEDEIAAISEALGASYAGVRSSVGTSGGGFALMVESLSYAGMAELPLVVYLAQRPGPATGLPTWTGQGDLLFAVHAGHGEFPKIVLSPGDIQEMIELTAEAYNLADTYQIPVILLTDRLLAESQYTLSLDWLKTFNESFRVKRGKIVPKTDQNPYLRYKDSPDGISEYLIPGLKGNEAYWQANSYEHLEDGHTTEDAMEIQKQVGKRKKKTQTYLKSPDIHTPKVYGDLSKAQTVLVSYGSNKGAILQAQEVLKEQNQDVAYIHITHLYPLDESLVKPLFTHKGEYILVENSSTGQLGKLLREECGINITRELLRFDGRPIQAHDIVNFVLAR